MFALSDINTRGIGRIRDSYANPSLNFVSGLHNCLLNCYNCYAKPSNKRFIIPLQKTIAIWQLVSIFCKSIQKHPDSVWENDVNNEQNVRTYYAKPLNERLIMYCKRKMLFWLLFSSKSIQNILILLAIVAPSPSASIRPVVNRLNQDTTVYYGLVFCLFS